MFQYQNLINFVYLDYFLVFIIRLLLYSICCGYIIYICCGYAKYGNDECKTSNPWIIHSLYFVWFHPCITIHFICFALNPGYTRMQSYSRISKLCFILFLDRTMTKFMQILTDMIFSSLIEYESSKKNVNLYQSKYMPQHI